MGRIRLTPPKKVHGLHREYVTFFGHLSLTPATNKRLKRGQFCLNCKRGPDPGSILHCGHCDRLSPEGEIFALRDDHRDVLPEVRQEPVKPLATRMHGKPNAKRKGPKIAPKLTVEERRALVADAHRGGLDPDVASRWLVTIGQPAS